MANTEVRLIIFFATKDGDALHSQQRQDWEVNVAQIMNSLLPNSDLNWRKQGKPLDHSVQFSSVQSLSCVRLIVTPRTAAHQASLSITNSQSLPKCMSIESVMPSNHLILFLPLLIPPSIFPSIRFFSSKSVLHIRWPKYWSFSFSIGHYNEYSGWSV